MKKTSKNHELLNAAKRKTSSKLYPILVQLVNEEREDLAELVLKVDYLLEYASSSIKQKYVNDGKEALEVAKKRIDALKSEKVDVSYLEYLHEGISAKCKK